MISRDVLSALALIVSFSLWAASHALLAISLSRKNPRWHGPVALVVLPLAPYWGARAGSRALASVWIVALTGWIVARIFLAH